MKTRGALALLATAVSLAAPNATSAAISNEEARAWHPDTQAAREFAESRSTRVSFAIFDMRERLGRGGDVDPFIMASTFKVMLMVAYLRQSSVASRELTARERDLLRPMIRRSDNDSATQVRDMLGRAPIESLASAAGMRSFAWSDIWGYCKTTPRDQALFLRRVRGLLPDRHRAFAMRQLENIIGRHRWGIAHARPPGWDLYFKGGWGLRGYRVEHQVALLRHGKRRLGVAVYTQGNPSRAYGRATLEGVFRRLLKDLPR
jgi:hypothetical protein